MRTFIGVKIKVPVQIIILNTNRANPSNKSPPTSREVKGDCSHSKS